MTRRTFAQAADRRAVAGYAARYAAEIDALVKKRRVTAAEGGLLKRRIAAFADGIGQGFHVEEAAHG